MIGEFICETRDGKPYIIRADPVIQASAELVHWWTLGGLPKSVPHHVACHVYENETIIVLSGSNAEYTYRLGNYDYRTGMWTLSWPD